MDHLKPTSSMRTLCACLFFLTLIISKSAFAAPLTVNFAWAGQGGYTATGTIIYDGDAPFEVFAVGSGATGGIEYLEMTFFDPSGSEVVSMNPISGGISTYFPVYVRFDTVTQEFVPNDMFSIGESGPEAVGTYGFYALVNDSYGDFFQITSLQPSTNTTFDSDPNITYPQPEPEPEPEPEPQSEPHQVPTMSAYGLGLTGAILLILAVQRLPRRKA